MTRKTGTVAPQATTLVAEAGAEVVRHETVDDRIDAALDVRQEVDDQLKERKELKYMLS